MLQSRSVQFTPYTVFLMARLKTGVIDSNSFGAAAHMRSGIVQYIGVGNYIHNPKFKRMVKSLGYLLV